MQSSHLTFTENLRQIGEKKPNWLLLKVNRKPFDIEQNPIITEREFPIIDGYFIEQEHMSLQKKKFSNSPWYSGHSFRCFIDFEVSVITVKDYSRRVFVAVEMVNSLGFFFLHDHQDINAKTQLLSWTNSLFSVRYFLSRSTFFPQGRQNHFGALNGTDTSRNLQIRRDFWMLLIFQQVKHFENFGWSSAGQLLNCFLDDENTPAKVKCSIDNKLKQWKLWRSVQNS